MGVSGALSAAFVHQGKNKIVYWLAADQNAAARPVLTVSAPSETIDILRFFSSTNDSKPILWFTVRDGQKARVMVSEASTDGRSVADILLDSSTSGLTLMSTNRVVWYSNVSKTPDREPLHIVDF